MCIGRGQPESYTWKWQQTPCIGSWIICWRHHVRGVASVLGAFTRLRKVTTSFSKLSVRPSAWNNSAPTGRIFKRFRYEYFSKSADKTRVRLKPDKNNGYFTWRPMYIMTISRWMRTVSDKSCRENQNTHFMLNNFFLPQSRHIWDNVQKHGSARLQYNTANALCLLDN